MAFLDRAEFLVEAKDITATTELISRDYVTQKGRDAADIQRLLTTYFFHHKSVHLVGKLVTLEIPVPGTAEVVAYVGAAASVKGLGDPTTRWHRDLLKLEAELVYEQDGHWRLHKLDWQRASRADFLP